MNRETRLRGVLDFLFLLCVLGGLAINLFLLSRSLTHDVSGVSGCGGGGCEELLASRWAVVFGIPVTAFGLVVYFALLASSTELFRPVHGPLLGMVAGAATWFVFVQAVILKSFCPWCMAAHGLGFMVVLLGTARSFANDGVAGAVGKTAVWAVAGFLGIGLLQVYSPARAGYRIDGEVVGSRLARDVAVKNGRIVFFDDGRKSCQVEQLPCLGRTGAKNILVEYFDYQCAACRKMAGYVDALVAKHPADVAVLVLPVPLDSSCNPHVPAGSQHSGSCAVARIALAVWRVKPETFEDYHRSLIAEPSEESARRLALGLMTQDQLESVMKDPWIEKRLQDNVTDWHDLSKSSDKLPKLLIRGRRILHGLPSGEADFIRVMEQELGL
jgi:uncharacterized membrane protein